MSSHDERFPIKDSANRVLVSDLFRQCLRDVHTLCTHLIEVHLLTFNFAGQCGYCAPYWLGLALHKAPLYYSGLRPVCSAYNKQILDHKRKNLVGSDSLGEGQDKVEIERWCAAVTGIAAVP